MLEFSKCTLGSRLSVQYNKHVVWLELLSVWSLQSSFESTQCRGLPDWASHTVLPTCAKRLLFIRLVLQWICVYCRLGTAIYELWTSSMPLGLFSRKQSNCIFHVLFIIIESNTRNCTMEMVKNWRKCFQKKFSNLYGAVLWISDILCFWQ